MKQAALLDGATIHAAGAAFQRLDLHSSVRPINVLALSSLIDSYVLFERLVVPEINWRYFLSFAPPDWVHYLEKVVEPVAIQFDSQGLKAFLADAYIFWILNGMLAVDKKLMIEMDYRTYVGGDFGNQPGSEASWKEITFIQESLRKHWKSDRKELEWSYNAANLEHVDAVHAAWRGCNYSQYCAEHGYWYIPHELRGTLLDFHAAFTGHPVSEPLVNKVVDTMKKLYFDQTRAALEGVPQKFIPRRPKSELLWRQFEMPLISAGVFQRSETLYNLFDEADELRRSAAPFRAACAEADLSEHEGRPDKAAEFYGQLVDLFKDIGKTYEAPRINWSVSFSFPWKLGISGSLPKSTGPRHLNFIRDIYSSRLLPLTFQSDLTRLFGQDPSDWLRTYGREQVNAIPAPKAAGSGD
jgi:hypothetical protein